jgi:hypothetical protein
VKPIVGWLLVAAVNVVAIGIVLAAGEWYARDLAEERANVPPPDALTMCRPDASTIWRYKPNYETSLRADEFEVGIRTNEAGLREGPIPPEGPDTVLFIGDSFTFGWGVAEQKRFSNVAAAALGRPVRAINAGHWMYTFDQQLVLMKELIRVYRPKVVVQGFFWLHVRTLHNHRQTYSPDGRLIAVSDPKLTVDQRGVLRIRSDWLERPPLHSQLLALVARQLLNLELRITATEWVDYLRAGHTGADPLWRLTGSIVAETAAVLREQGIEYVPFLIPAGVEFTDSMWMTVGWRESTPPPGVDVGLPARRFKAIFEKAGLGVMDPSDEMKRHGGGALYFPKDGHWNDEGHRFIGRWLAPAIVGALNRKPSP